LDSYDTLITKAALHSSKLLKKPDQCRGVYLSSHLWWTTGEDEGGLFRDGKRALECLQKALKIADSCMDPVTNVELFVEILNRYIYYFEKDNEAVSRHLFCICVLQQQQVFFFFFLHNAQNGLFRCIKD
jgi:vacuolar protein sorting-associated protein 35